MSLVPDRILDLSEHSAQLQIRGGLLVIETGDQHTSVPPKDLAAVIISHPGTTISGSALAALGSAGCVVLAADRNRLPALVGLGVVGHSTQTERIRAQVEARKPLVKRAWQQIVRLKIQRQGVCLETVTGKRNGLATLADRVRSGDPTNVESQAARRYWLALMGPGYTRGKEWDGFNATLDYGYAIVRAFVARAVVAAGLHPSVGLHHHNRYNPFSLVDDLFEPFRPEVDLIVHRLWCEGGRRLELGPETKRRLVGELTKRRLLEGERRRLGDCCQSVAVSLCRCLEQARRDLAYPDMLLCDPGASAC